MMFKFFASPASLKKRGLIGINRRNADLIMRHNPRHLYPLVDDKLITKQRALDAGIPVPELYSVIQYQRQTHNLAALLKQHEDFVIKPAKGSGGNGILIIAGQFGDHFRKPSGELVSLSELEHHVSNILSGMYSLGGVADKAIIEYRVKFAPIFKDIIFQGVPDIRLIVFLGIPVAAMVRLPTRASDGKANLHQGALGVGIDLASGESRGGVLLNRYCTLHPDTHTSTAGLKIPHWDAILRMAITCADTVGLGYLGVDIVMDRDLGPLMLELNARPGLNVQIANQTGLKESIRTIRALTSLPTDVDERIQIAHSLANVARADASGI